MKYFTMGGRNHETAGIIYKNARAFAEAQVRNGNIPASAMETQFAKYAAESLTNSGISVPAHIAQKAGSGVAKAVGVGAVGAAGFAGSALVTGVAVAAGAVAVGGAAYFAYKGIKKLFGR